MQSTRRTSTSTFLDYPHSTVKQLHGASVRELIQKIENHPHRHALQSGLQQHRQFNLFSKESQDMIKAAGNIELCELLDVEPKAQCKVCLSYWNVGIGYCTCGHSCEMDRMRTRNSSSTLLISFRFPGYYIRKGRPHGHRYGKKEGDHEYFIANSLKKKCMFLPCALHGVEASYLSKGVFFEVACCRYACCLVSKAAAC